MRGRSGRDDVWLTRITAVLVAGAVLLFCLVMGALFGVW